MRMWHEWRRRPWKILFKFPTHLQCMSKIPKRLINGCRKEKKDFHFVWSVELWAHGYTAPPNMKRKTFPRSSSHSQFTYGSNFDFWSVYRVNAKLNVCHPYRVAWTWFVRRLLSCFSWAEHSEWNLCGSTAPGICFYFREKLRHRYRTPRNGRREKPNVICYRDSKYMAAVMR